MLLARANAVSKVAPQTRSLLAAAISAADHGYFDDAQLLLSDALVADYAPEIAQAIDAIQRRDAHCRSVDLRPELHSLFTVSHSSAHVDNSAAPPATATPSAMGEDFWSDIVIDFDEPNVASIEEVTGEIAPVPEATEPVSPRFEQPDTEPEHAERHASARTHDAAVSPEPPPPSYRLAARHPLSEEGSPLSDDRGPLRADQLSDERLTPPQRFSSERMATVTVGYIDAGISADASMDGSHTIAAPAAKASDRLQEPTPLTLRQLAETPFVSSAVAQASARRGDSAAQRASERDTVMVEAVMDTVAEDAGHAGPRVEESIATVLPDTQFADPPSQWQQAASTGPAEPETMPASEAVLRAATTASTSDAESVPRAELRHEPEFLTEERSARFTVTPPRGADRHPPTEWAHKHIHSGVDSSESLPPTREVLGGTLAPRLLDLTAELQLLGRRILKQNAMSIQSARASLTPRTMFLLDQIDDRSTVEDIVDVTGLPAHEAYTLIRQLVDQGLVYFD